jgi:hypothetical protein
MRYGKPEPWKAVKAATGSTHPKRREKNRTNTPSRSASRKPPNEGREAPDTSERLGKKEKTNTTVDPKPKLRKKTVRIESPSSSEEQEAFYEPKNPKADVQRVQTRKNLNMKDIWEAGPLVRLKDDQKVKSIQCIKWANNSCYWDGPSEAIYWVIRPSFDIISQQLMASSNLPAVAAFISYLLDRYTLETTALGKSNPVQYFKTSLMKIRESVLDRFAEEGVIPRKGAIYSAGVSDMIA